jgi:pyrimidine deaminase RibD-like protein
MGTGVNKYINSPFKVSPEHVAGCSIHAEVAAIRNAGGNVKGAVLYVARINNRGEAMYSAPCGKCQKELSRYKIRRAVWTQ